MAKKKKDLPVEEVEEVEVPEEPTPEPAPQPEPVEVPHTPPGSFEVNRPPRE